MGQNVAQKLIASHLVEGEMKPGEEIGLHIDQTLTQDATGTMVMLSLEAMDLDRVKTELSVQYIDHNLLQTDFKNADDHLFLRSACQRFGIWFSRPGNGVSHPVHMERFGVPGKVLLGSDSHTPAAGSIGMLAIGAGGLEVAMVMAGKPYHLNMPKIFGVKLVGRLPDWVSAKDVILEMLRRYDVKGGIGWIYEFFGPGLDGLSAMDRHVIANMGTELGATTTVFPADAEVEQFFIGQHRERDFVELLPDEDATYDEVVEIDLSQLEPLIAKPSSPGSVVPVRELVGRKVYQSMVGSSANPGFRDFAITAEIVEDKMAHDRVSFDINPSSRQVLENLIESGHLMKLVRAGGRVHQAGCNGCIGMGQAPATDRISLRTVPRNFPGRSGTKEDAVYLCSPETAAAAALTGEITDPRDLGIPYPKAAEPKKYSINTAMLVPPVEEGQRTALVKGPNIQPLPRFAPLCDEMRGPVLLKAGNNVSTDEISPAGAKVLPFRSNIPELSKFTFSQLDESYYERAERYQLSGHFVVGGLNYGQGSSREHAAMAPRFLGVQAVLTKSFARIHRQNLINYGILPLNFNDRADYSNIDQGDELELKDVLKQIQNGPTVIVHNETKGMDIETSHGLSERQVAVIIHGGVINLFKKEL